jgi:propionyl-CoA synthetase
VLDYSRPPFAKWFVGGETNLCHNAVDRHLKDRGDQNALIWISTEVEKTETYTYKKLHAEVNRVAAMMQSLGLKRGDRVIIYMPNMPEAVFAILACARLGAVTRGVRRFRCGQPGGAHRRRQAGADDHGRRRSRAGRVVPYKPLVDESIRLSKFPLARY